MRILTVSCLSYYFSLSTSFLFNRPSQIKAKFQYPIEKYDKKPILKVTEPFTRSEVYLVGVSHGSPSSSKLVENTIRELNPSVVVLELCFDRLIAICIDAGISPHGNMTWAQRYDEVLQKIKKREETPSTGLFSSNPSMKRFISTLQFIQSQGLVAGFFILIGLVGTSSQLLTSYLSTAFSGAGSVSDKPLAMPTQFSKNPTQALKVEDEFTTAIRVSKELNIPLRLGDASQNDTLSSLRDLFSYDLLNPRELLDNTKNLAFSLLGALPRSSNTTISEAIPSNLISQSSWLNIPRAYADDPSLIKALLPILTCLILVLLLPELYLFPDMPSTTDVNAMESVQEASSLGNSLSQETVFENILSVIPNKMSRIISSVFRGGLQIAQSIPTGVTENTNDAVSIFDDFVASMNQLLEASILVRLAKIIGMKRDAVLAKNIQSTAQEFKGKKIVVVIGMLHTNGIARWILSGLDPSSRMLPTAAADPRQNTKF